MTMFDNYIKNDYDLNIFSFSVGMKVVNSFISINGTDHGYMYKIFTSTADDAFVCVSNDVVIHEADCFDQIIHFIKSKGLDVNDIICFRSEHIQYTDLLNRTELIDRTDEEMHDIILLASAGFKDLRGNPNYATIDQNIDVPLDFLY